MCLGIPGRVVAVQLGCDLADVEVAGTVRKINVGLFDEPPRAGEYVLIHSGFALERMTVEEARDALDFYRGDEL